MGAGEGGDVRSVGVEALRQIEKISRRSSQRPGDGGSVTTMRTGRW